MFVFFFFRAKEFSLVIPFTRLENSYLFFALFWYLPAILNEASYYFGRSLALREAHYIARTYSLRHAHIKVGFISAFFRETGTRLSQSTTTNRFLSGGVRACA